SILSTSARPVINDYALAPISFCTHGGFNDNPDPAGHRDRLLPGPSSCPLADRPGSAPRDPRITSWLVRRQEPASRRQVTHQARGTGRPLACGFPGMPMLPCAEIRPVQLYSRETAWAPHSLL